MRCTILAGLAIALGLGGEPGPAAENCKRPDKGPAKSTSNAMDEIQLSIAQKGKTLVTQVGQTLCLRLPGDRANGTWSLAKLGGDALRQVGKNEYIAGPREAGKVGGVSVFRFKAAKAGKATIKASFAPSQGGRPTNTFSVTIHVTGAG